MSVGRQVTALIGRYGKGVTLCTMEGESLLRRESVALIQYVKGTAKQYSYSPLGEENGQKLLYLGLGTEPLTAEVDWVLWDGKRYQVISAHPVYYGGEVAYWRGILKEMPLGCQGNLDLPWESETDVETETDVEMDVESEVEDGD